jgi:predicted ArsR family transcriptional regulator
METRRQEILHILKRQGEATVGELAKVLDLTPVTVRHHLDVLRAEGLAEAPAVRRRHGPGRPQYVYTLTAQAEDRFPKSYNLLALELLDEIKSQLDETAVSDILDRIALRRLDRAPQLDRDVPQEERLDKLVAYMGELGYIAEWEQEGSSLYVRASNCPYHDVSTRHSELCSMDLFLFEQLSGLQLTRVQHMTEGAHACVYQVAFSSEE